MPYIRVLLVARQLLISKLYHGEEKSAISEDFGEPAGALGECRVGFLFLLCAPCSDDASEFHRGFTIQPKFPKATLF
jgi:hypothetical protein